jgi:alkylation response protein AidB-like acyl-CoA dehydrogenase
MDFQFSKEDEAFRQTVRAFLKDNLPEKMRRHAYSSAHGFGRETLLAWARILAKQGWSTPNWPKEYGGPGWTAMQRHIFDAECWQADAPTTHFQTFLLMGPTLIRFGNEEQRKRFLPPIQRGEVIWSQGFSEPNAGSDLASLKTTAVRRGDKYIMNGTKIWTSGSHFADWCFFLVRTNPEVKAQHGISFLLADLKSPGITIRPIISIDGQHHLNQVFLDNVEVPAENLVGEEGKGWTYAKNLLEDERAGSAFINRSKRNVGKAREIAGKEMKNGRPLIEDPEFRRRMARIEIELQALEYSVLRVLANEKTKYHGNAVAGVLKIHGSELQQKVADLMLEALGPRALREFPEDYDAFSELEAALWPSYIKGRTADAMMARAATIYGGSAQVQRTVIAKLAFGL